MYEKILVPLDGSRRAERILAHVEEIARHFDSKLVLLRVVEPDLNIVGSQIAPPEFYIEAHKRWVEEARGYLTGLQGELRQRGIQVQIAVEEGPIATTILNVAARENVELVAMASHGRSGLSRVFYGSVAAGVLHRIDRPLLLVRADEVN